jgi:hypothetical protein
MAVFPIDLIPVIRMRWRNRSRPRVIPAFRLPSDSVLQHFLETAFHASLLTEEGRRPGFRIALLDADDKGTELQRMHFHNGVRRIVFESDRPYSVGEVNRLGPAADFTRSIIGARNRGTGANPDLRIWGLLDVGENWYRFVRHEASGGKPPPNALTITSLSPGELSLSIGGTILCTLREGSLSIPASYALWGGPLNDFLKSAQSELYREVIGTLNVAKWDEEGDDDYPHRTYLMFLERILTHVREKRHGGTILMIPDNLSPADTRMTDRIVVKYACNYDHAWGLLKRHLVNHRRYYDLNFRLWDSKNRINVKDFQDDGLLKSEGEEIDEAIGDVANMIATLTAVDGAVLITDRFRVLGFGTEVVAASPSLQSVKIQSDVTQDVPIESFGTRHRSAFRFCSSLEDCAAFLVSQDGGVKAVKRVGADVLLWQDINAGAMGI